jgi:hypothetical protein
MTQTSWNYCPDRVKAKIVLYIDGDSVVLMCTCHCQSWLMV